MTVDQLQSFLIWCAGLNYAILLIWFGVFSLAHDWLYQMHSRWFKLSVEMFDGLNYSGVAIYKIGIILFVVVPLIALVMVNGRP